MTRTYVACALLVLLLAGCAAPNDPSASVATIRAERPTSHPSPTTDPDLQVETTVLNATLVCSLANRWFWFPDETRSCLADTLESVVVPAGAVLISVDVTWEAAQPAARNLTLAAFHGREGAIEFARVSGPSPLRIDLWERLTREYYRFGGELGIEVEAATGVLGRDVDADVAAAAAQDVTIQVTVVYDQNA